MSLVLLERMLILLNFLWIMVSTLSTSTRKTIQRYTTQSSLGTLKLLFFSSKKAYQEDELPMSELQRALFEAVRVDRLDLVQYLIESGVDVHYTNFQGRNALHEAAASASIQSIGFLLDHEVNLQQADKFGMTLVLEACRHGFLDTVQLLLEAGGSISDVNIAGQTALHLSAQNCYTEVVELLLNLDADVYQCDKRGWTPLHGAASEGHTPVAELLRANGANLDAETLWGETAEDLALKRDHDDCLRDFRAESTVLERLTSAELDPYEEFLLDPNEIFFNVNQTNADDTLNGSWLDAPIAVKLKKRDRIAKYFVEALSQWARLNHPHIVKLYGFCHSDDEPYFVYERAMYQSLSEYQKSDNFITFGDIWEKLYQAALGPQYLHERNIIHGTLCDRSIVVVFNGSAKLHIFDSAGFYSTPETLSGLPPSFDSDVYAFGLIIADTISNWAMWELYNLSEIDDTIRSGELPEKPDNISTTQWHLIKQMCCDDLADRPSISDVVRELEAFTVGCLVDNEYEEMLSWASVGDFYVGDSNVSQLLTEIEETCGDSMTIDQMNRDMYNRLVDIFNQLQAQPEAPALDVAQRYGEIVRYFHMRLKTTIAVGAAQVARFAASRQGADDTFSIHNDIDIFLNTASLSKSSEVHLWRDQWEQQRRQQQHEILEKLEDLPTLFEDVDDEQEREETLTYLRFELSKYLTSYATSKMTDFTHAKSTIAAISMSTNPNWFIPAREVTFDKFDEFGRGAFGKIYHGRWNRSRVVVEKVKLRSEEVEVAFLNEVEVWHKLYHPNVMILYCACHIQRPFFVCEYAGGGQLDNIYEIIQMSDGQARLTDFGLSTVESGDTDGSEDSESEFEIKGKVWVGAIRWKAPEVLQGEKSTFASDIYLFGMCIIEAVSGKYPWGTTLDAVVKYFVVRKKCIPERPVNCSEEAYALVEQMCQFEPDERIEMNEVVEGLKALRE